MKKIVGLIQPFLFKKQIIFVYEDKKLVETKEVHMSDFVQEIVQTSKKTNAKEVLLKGPKSYMNRFAKEIKEEEIKRYSENQIQVEIFQRGEKIND